MLEALGEFVFLDFLDRMNVQIILNIQKWIFVKMAKKACVDIRLQFQFSLIKIFYIICIYLLQKASDYQ